MKKLFGAMLVALSLGSAGIGYAATFNKGSSISDNVHATRMQQTGSYTP